jgi:hypothetical protein
MSTESSASNGHGVLGLRAVRLVSTAVWCSLLAATPAPGRTRSVEPKEFTISVRFDSWDESEVAPTGTVTVTAQPDGIVPPRTNELPGDAAIRYRVPIPEFVLAPSLRVAVAPTSSWIAREIALWDPPSAPLHVHLLRAGAHTDEWSSLTARDRLKAYQQIKETEGVDTTALRYLDQAMAYFGAFSPPRVQELRASDPVQAAWYQYNYATSLAGACTEGFATCTASRKQCRQLADLIDVPDRAWLLSKLKVSERQVTLCATLPDQVEVKLEYRRIGRSFQQAVLLDDAGKPAEAASRYLDAARFADTALQAFDAHEQAWTDNRITRARLLNDGGTAYLLYGNRAASAPEGDLSACAAWQEAENRLRQIPATQRDRATRENLAIHLSSKLEGCAARSA